MLPLIMAIVFGIGAREAGRNWVGGAILGADRF
jgi:hypothetical protein